MTSRTGHRRLNKRIFATTRRESKAKPPGRRRRESPPKRHQAEVKSHAPPHHSASRKRKIEEVEARICGRGDATLCHALSIAEARRRSKEKTTPSKPNSKSRLTSLDQKTRLLQNLSPPQPGVPIEQDDSGGSSRPRAHNISARTGRERASKGKNEEKGREVPPTPASKPTPE
ncbi:hypothetical protein F2Q69_00040266 [Brassica cretica]|uniref:Uncharacterized protein n=1 Tax=Brassica cretica TaxID=69181 RepID=A0A8S9NK20_BRACR|nr:hypothetical protein F2Q69_00040266 [Brassica cretica]